MRRRSRRELSQQERTETKEIDREEGTPQDKGIGVGGGGRPRESPANGAANSKQGSTKTTKGG